MNRMVLASGVIAVLVAIAGVLGSGWRTGRLEKQLQDAQAKAVRFEQQVGELRAEKEQRRPGEPADPADAAASVSLPAPILLP